MNSLPAMDWNAKWDWENLVMFNSKTMESHKKQPTDWGIEGEGEIDTGSFNLYWSGCGGSGSDLAHGSSARSSISASTGSSSKEAFHHFPGDFNKKIDLARAELAGTSPTLDSSVGSGEPMIGLKLGKRTYFENNCSGSNAKTPSFSMIPVASAASITKKTKSTCQSTPPPRCQVEGCNLDLSSAKEYHRKHKVCENHSKFSKVVVGGVERRFCQQCSRWESWDATAGLLVERCPICSHKIFSKSSMGNYKQLQVHTNKGVSNEIRKNWRHQWAAAIARH